MTCSSVSRSFLVKAVSWRADLTAAETLGGSCFAAVLSVLVPARSVLIPARSVFALVLSLVCACRVEMLVNKANNRIKRFISGF